MPKSLTLVTQKDMKALEIAFQEAAVTKSLDFEEIRKEFCRLWPTIKTGLDLLSKIADLIPGVGALVKLGIKAAMIGGEAAYKAYCPKA